MRNAFLLACHGFLTTAHCFGDLAKHMHAMLCYAMLCYAMLCYAMLCYAMLCYAMLCYAMLCYAMLCLAMHAWLIMLNTHHWLLC